MYQAYPSNIFGKIPYENNLLKGIKMLDDDEKLRLSIQICKLYYENDFSQQLIANKLNISRSYVSKLLIEAKRVGIVEIKIKDTLETESELEKRIREIFSLKKVIVVPVKTNVFEEKLEVVGNAFSKYIYNIVNEGDIIGVSWGVTLKVCAQQLIKKELSNVTVTQLNGGLTHVDKCVHVSEIVNSFAQAFNASPYFLPLPAILDSEEMKNTIIKDRNISNVLKLALSSNIAVFAVGEFGFNSSLVRNGYFTNLDVEELLSKGVVGDACGRLININGDVIDSDFDRRTIGIPLSNLRKKKYSILVSAEDKRVKGVYGVLKGGYANVFVTDEITANALRDVIYK